MATLAFTAAATQLSITATAPATLDAAGFGALSFTEVGDVVDLGEFGKNFEEITHNPITDRKTYKIKGSYNEGSMAMQLAVPGGPTGDAGQTILIAASDSDSDYYFKIEYNDNPDGLTNTIRYFPAKVMSYVEQPGSVNSIVSGTANVSISGSIVRVAATDS